MVNAFFLFVPCLIDGLENLVETGSTIARLSGKIGSAPKRVPFGCKEHGERPAPCYASRVERGHVDLVYIGTLLAVDLDIHKEPVHENGGFRILEALMGHDMTPMACSVSD